MREGKRAGGRGCGGDGICLQGTKGGLTEGPKDSSTNVSNTTTSIPPTTEPASQPQTPKPIPPPTTTIPPPRPPGPFLYTPNPTSRPSTSSSSNDNNSLPTIATPAPPSKPVTGQIVAVPSIVPGPSPVSRVEWSRRMRRYQSEEVRYLGLELVGPAADVTVRRRVYRGEGPGRSMGELVVRRENGIRDWGVQTDITGCFVVL